MVEKHFYRFNGKPVDVEEFSNMKTKKSFYRAIFQSGNENITDKMLWKIAKIMGLMKG